MPPVSLAVKTLTPIWTGDIDGRADREILVTSLMGSLRWWMEALLRGAGAPVTDPTCEHTVFERGKPDRRDASELLFGCTGWQRRFRLDLGLAQVASVPVASPVSGGNHRSWYFRSGAMGGHFQLRITALTRQMRSGDEPFDEELIGDLIRFVLKWGSLGARGQMGFGFCEAPGGTAYPHLDHYLATNAGTQTDGRGLPSLRDMFFAEVRKTTNGPFADRINFDVKIGLRNALRARSTEGPAEQAKWNRIRYEILGRISSNDDERMGSKVNVSRPLQNGRKLACWGWVPRSSAIADVRTNREEILNRIAYELGEYGEVTWQECEDETPGLAYFRTLAGGGA